jgi:hypothetical protein
MPGRFRRSIPIKLQTPPQTPFFVTPTMAPLDQVPNELWLEIFDHLSWETLKYVSLTQRSFYRISRHLIFADFHFHPYATSGLSLLLPSVAKIKRAIERLEFWTSSDVAPLVRSCKLTPWVDSTPRHHTDTPYILLAPFFGRLACFTGLRHLYANQVHFNQIGMANLCCLPALAYLRISGCRVGAGEPIDLSSLALRVSSFAFDPIDSQDEGITHWIPLLNADHLRKLEVASTPRFFDKITETMPSFHRLHTLSLTLDVSKTARNLMILSKFPAVQVLSLSGPYQRGGWDEAGSDLQAADILPVLKKYKGYFRTLPIFLAVPTLTRLEAYEPFGFDGSPSHFMRQLKGLPIPSRITALNVHFHNLEYAAIAPLSAFFAHLTQLSISVHAQIAADGVNRQVSFPFPSF